MLHFNKCYRLWVIKRAWNARRGCFEYVATNPDRPGVEGRADSEARLHAWIDAQDNLPTWRVTDKFDGRTWTVRATDKEDAIREVGEHAARLWVHKVRGT